MACFSFIFLLIANKSTKCRNEEDGNDSMIQKDKVNIYWMKKLCVCFAYVRGWRIYQRNLMKRETMTDNFATV